MLVYSDEFCSHKWYEQMFTFACKQKYDSSERVATFFEFFFLYIRRYSMCVDLCFHFKWRYPKLCLCYFHSWWLNPVIHWRLQTKDSPDSLPFQTIFTSKTKREIVWQFPITVCLCCVDHAVNCISDLNNCFIFSFRIHNVTQCHTLFEWYSLSAIKTSLIFSQLNFESQWKCLNV